MLIWSEIYFVERTNTPVTDLVKKALNELDPNKSPEPDQLNACLLTEPSDLITGPLITLTIKTGGLAADWKKAFITPNV